MHYNKIFLLLIAFTYTSLQAQKAPGWHLKDKKTDGIQGISLNEAYAFLQSKKLKSTPVIVAVIDGGIDTAHEDLKAIRWINTNEIAGNGKDDDKNGYIDDTNGWSFLGGKNGNVTVDSDERSRVYHAFKSIYEGKIIEEQKLNPAQLYQYQTWKRAKDDMFNQENPVDVAFLTKILASIKASNDSLITYLGRPTFTGKELEQFTPATDAQRKAKAMFLGILKAQNMMDVKNTDFVNGVEEEISGLLRAEDAKVNPPKNYRGIAVSDDATVWTPKGYGTNDLMATPASARHGSHVTGIIAANRTNGTGIQGVADNVKVITLRTVPDGDEHDKDIAYAIRYAVDNGAKVVNMSFGKSYSPQKQWVDDAVLYAQQKGVLLIHAAGNDGKNLDDKKNYNYPNPRLLNGKTATNWIEVGASGDSELNVKYTNAVGEKLTEDLAANFSNYGKRNVDVFAPGIVIYSTVPGGNTYEDLQGTSMAAPVVTGLAAMLKSYFPKLTASQLKMVIENSVVKSAKQVAIPGSSNKASFATLSKTGGIVNALTAVQLAAKITK